MIRSLPFILVLLMALQLRGQQTVDDLKRPKGVLQISGFSYPIFFDGETHSSFLLDYELNKNLGVQLRGFYDTYLISNRTRFDFLGKYYFTKKMYILSGIQIEMEQAKINNATPRPPRVGIQYGMGYEVNPNLILEGKGNIQINKSSMGSFGEYVIPTPQVYTLGGKLKF
ncbi:hypothetical protein [Costertonia aggregata]|uniref:Porin family protein n=1 Tax=Costertonia aggregata TaxID=343403 RepID=A0A7H9ASK0_9FLAO|nr:hypothetical protein [Costertonia aggregata]QLG46433.1 hypothetical protein HYG79_14105 [Costertonia aggregata]